MNIELYNRFDNIYYDYRDQIPKSVEQRSIDKIYGLTFIRILDHSLSILDSRWREHPCYCPTKDLRYE